ncbi:Protein hcp1 [Alphaproteobacteria bacterium SO-S41]|nr:Protein hcp1 [Alphaproteobacteria bacterium SO-S41]
MASDFLLKIEGIRGESEDKDFPDHIEVKGWSYGMANPLDAATRQRVGQVQLTDLTIIKALDKASPVLLEKCARNFTFDSAKLTVRKAGGQQLGYFFVEMKKVRIRSLNTKANDTDSITPVETLVLTFQKIEWTYKEQSALGTLKGEVKYQHDISTNT